MNQLRDEEMMKRLRAEKFDFAFTEFFDVCGMAVIEKIGIKKYGALVAGTLSGMFTSVYGIPATLSFVPEMTVNAVPPLSFWDRMKNVLIASSGQAFFLPKMMGPINELSKKYIRPDFSLYNRLEEASVIFVNVNEVFGLSTSNHS
ncbi:Glucuronosyltransferase [Aphelenchoides bicaudatus]|nr:Glucuronosyltransferase [Aphelenchoides bicaudatus]